MTTTIKYAATGLSSSIKRPLRHLVGMHEIRAYWWGSARTLSSIMFGVGTNGLSRTVVIVVAIDETSYVFEETPIEYGPPGDRSTMCGDVLEMATPPAFPWGWQAGRDKPPILATFRLLETDQYEMLYAVDEASGKCVFKVGTNLKAKYTHVWQPGRPWESAKYTHVWQPGRESTTSDGLRFEHAVDPDGVAAPWLEPAEDNPPVEIPSKKKHQTEVKRTGYRGKGIADRHEKYAHYVNAKAGK